MKKNSFIQLAVLTGCLVFLCVTGAWSSGSDEFLTGNVFKPDVSGLSLNKRMADAESAFQKNGKGDLFFSGYVFQSRHTIEWGNSHGQSGTYTVSVSGDSIKMKHPSRQGENRSMSSEEGGEPAGLLVLQKKSGRTTKILDIQLMDLDNTYAFNEIPLYWLGEAETDESLAWLENTYTRSEHNVQKDIIFLAYSHDSDRSFDFLEKTALSDTSTQLRKDAIFWIGNLKSSRSLTLLKNIMAKETDTDVRKQVVFALHLSDDENALKELIHLARQDKSSEVRKQAIFWLGQKATKESTRALKDFVENDESTEVKKQAVFAISQLPEKESVPLLVDIARNHKNLEVRKNAMFWLGQKDSEEALKLFEEILLKK
ncbi:MAG: HEAT repeat domain-containing protein [Candidatus Aminicenantes bacterium]|nr:HEAT repeat domain-containing protein [Candidatus Aminicenantes bacterium]